MANRREVSEQRTIWTAEGVDTVVAGAQRISAASAVAFQKTTEAAGKQSALLAASLAKSNKAAFEAASSASKAAVSGSGDRLSAVAAQRRAAAMAVAARAASKAVADAANRTIEASTSASLARQKVKIEAFKASLRKELADKTTTPEGAAQRLRYGIIQARAEAAAEIEAAKKTVAGKLAAGAQHDASTVAAVRNAAAQNAAAKAAEAAAKRQAEVHKQVAQSAAAMWQAMEKFEQIAVKAFKAAYRATRTFIRALSSIARAIISLIKHLDRMAKAALHAGEKMASAMLGPPLHAVHALDHALLGVIRRLSRLATHEAWRIAKYGVGAYVAGSSALAYAAKDAVTTTQQRAIDVRDQAWDARMSPQELQAITGAAKAYGAPVDEILKAYNAFRQSVFTAQSDPESPQAQMLAQLGIQTTYNAGMYKVARNPSDLFTQFAGRENSMGYYAAMQASNTLLGGPDAMKNQGFFDWVGQRGPLAYREGLQREQMMGTYLSPADIARAREWRATIVDVKDAFLGVKEAISKQVYPTFKALADVAVSFLTTYRTQIADFVGNRVKALAYNIAQLVWIIHKEAEAYSKVTDKVASKMGVNLRPGAGGTDDTGAPLSGDQSIETSQPVILRAYNWFNANIRGKMMATLHSIAAAAKTAYAAAARFLAAFGINSLQTAVDKLVAAGHAMHVFGHEAMLALKGDYMTLAAENAPVFQRLASWRNATVAYVKQAIIDVRKVLSGDALTDDSTFVGRMAQRIKDFVQALPGWIEKIKATLKGAWDYVSNLWHNFEDVLHGKKSTDFPWMNKIKDWFDLIAKRVETAMGWFEKLFGAMEKLTQFLGFDLGSALMFIGLLNLTKVLQGVALVAGTVKTTLQGIAALGGVGAVSGAAGAGAEAGAAGIGAAGAAAGGAALLGLGVAAAVGGTAAYVVHAAKQDYQGRVDAETEREQAAAGRSRASQTGWFVHDVMEAVQQAKAVANASGARTHDEYLQNVVSAFSQTKGGQEAMKLHIFLNGYQIEQLTAGQAKDLYLNPGGRIVQDTGFSF
jgi:hypothetical protein